MSSSAPDASLGAAVLAREGLHRLPNEMLLHIMRKCPDFTSLWSLIQTSSRLSSIFDHNALDVVMCVMISTVPIQIQTMMRAVVRIRTRSFTLSPGESAILTAVATTSAPLHRHTAPALLRKFVGLAHNIHVLAHLCLLSCLQNCRSRGLYPSPFSDTFMSNDRLEPKCSRESFDIPSWIEEQRAILGFWQIQFVFELKLGRLKGRLDWSSDDLSKLSRMSLPRFWIGSQLGFYMETAWNSLESMKSMGGVKTSEQFSLISVVARLPEIQQPDEPLEFRLPVPGREHDYRFLCQPRPARRHGSLEDLEQLHLYEWPPGITFLMMIPDLGLKKHGLQVTYFGKLGFSLWDKKRMAAFGLFRLRSSPETDDISSEIIEKFKRLLDDLDKGEFAMALEDEDDDW